jgi:hypothetical protein
METETQLQRFKREGWLSVSQFRSVFKWMSEDDRFRAGNRLFKDFYYSGISAASIPDLAKPQVDGGHNKGMTERQALCLNSFRKALRAIPAEFFPIVQAIVLDDRNILFTQTNNSRKKAHFNHLVKQQLCWGLDRLANHYKNAYVVRSLPMKPLTIPELTPEDFIKGVR